MTTIICSNWLFSLICPIENSKLYPHQHQISIPQLCSAFSCLFPGWASAWNSLLHFHTWELSYNFQDPVRSKKPRIFPEIYRRSPSSWAPRTPYPLHFCPHRPVLLLLLFTCPWAPPGQRPCLIYICIPPAQPLCSINVWWMTEGKKCSLSENCSSEPCASALPRDVFVKCGFSVSDSNTILIHPEALEIQKS